MSKEEEKAIEILKDLGHNFQSACTKSLRCMPTYTLASRNTYSGQALAVAIMYILDLINKQQKLNKILLEDIYRTIQNDDEAAITSIYATDSDEFEDIVSKYNKLLEERL